ncbi:YqzE family protein [Paenalkalicoccus suaedae]|uniref:YqzE family protein n=1 Tax=Paenalkalicoccus suaedae TaxID=2592382 RepID=A0A859FFF1_9BACI|nr:YqzE family protein [Paenalkalicoccus suaedae]QKS70935.1 YqzE family protein [Paenalkalicoccus suaedae]
MKTDEYVRYVTTWAMKPKKRTHRPLAFHLFGFIPMAIRLLFSRHK